jgi:hypothetical protein
MARSECINIFDGKAYQLALEQTAQMDKVIPRTYAHVLYLYTKHPEVKSLASDGTPCTCGTRGLLQTVFCSRGITSIGGERNRPPMGARRGFESPGSFGSMESFGIHRNRGIRSNSIPDFVESKSPCPF